MASILLIILGIMILLVIIFRKYFDKHQSMAILVAILAILISSWFNTIQFQQQADQYIIDNRPSVFVSGWGNFSESSPNIRMLLRNVGKLPARIEHIDLTINGEDIDDPLFDKLAYIFPEQDNIHIDLPHPDIDFIMALKIDYYSINDNSKKNKFSYYIEYEFKIDPKDKTKFQDPILLKIDAD